MFKRQDSGAHNDDAAPAKRPKYNPDRESSERRSKDGSVRRRAKSDDVWGDDFAEEDIEEMDFVATQAILQEDVAMTQAQEKQNAEPLSEEPCCSKNLQYGILSQAETVKLSQQMQTPELSLATQINYAEFEKKLMSDRSHNSTFWTDRNAASADKETMLKELERLKNENQKLLNDFITKDGETAFLRKQLQQAQLQVESERLEKTRAMEEQDSRYKTGIGVLAKENEQLKTQLDLQKFEVGNLAERCKLLENGQVKLMQPAHFNSPRNQERLNQSINRLSLTNKPRRASDVSVQATSDDRDLYVLRTWAPYYPLARIPKFIFDAPQPEKPIVDIQVVEKTGRRNLPILQEEDTFRIFENPDLVKPITTSMDGKKLTTQCVLSEVASLQTMTSSELDSDKSIPMINKLVSTARELILNLIIVLETISGAMTNDDIRDMNDLYFSDLYLNLSYNMKSPCDSQPWHKGERGLEARRIFGLLSYVALESSYLCNYIAGNDRLMTETDQEYRRYSRQMTRYNGWSKKADRFEMMQIFAQFASLLETIRRSHQFSGLIYAITTLIYNVHKRIGLSGDVLEYVFRVFKDLVLARPLVCCYASLTNMMVVFVKSRDYLNKICLNSQTTAINNWRGSLHFTADACPLQIFLVQMETYDVDIISAIDITESLLLFIESAVRSNAIPLKSDSPVSCNCYVKLMRFAVRYLCRSSESNLNLVQESRLACQGSISTNGSCHLWEICERHRTGVPGSNERCLGEIYPRDLLDHERWTLWRRKQLKVVSDGIRFLYRLVICDSDYVIRLPETEDSFHLFMKNMAGFVDVLHVNESEALKRIRQTFIFDRGIQPEATLSQQRNSAHLLGIQDCFKGQSRSIDPGRRDPEQQGGCYDRMLASFKSLFDAPSVYDDS